LFPFTTEPHARQGCIVSDLGNGLYSRLTRQIEAREFFGRSDFEKK